MEFQCLFDAELPNQFTILIAVQKHKHPQTGYHSALSVALCQWLLCMLPLYIALLECTTEG
jgi:hypothetical protein